MIDAVTQKRIEVYTTGPDAMGITVPAHFIVPEEQLATVTEALKAHHILHWVDEETISIDGEPPVTFVTLSRGEDPEAVQRLLDSL